MYAFSPCYDKTHVQWYALDDIAELLEIKTECNFVNM